MGLILAAGCCCGCKPCALPASDLVLSVSDFAVNTIGSDIGGNGFDMARLHAWSGSCHGAANVPFTDWPPCPGLFYFAESREINLADVSPGEYSSEPELRFSFVRTHAVPPYGDGGATRTTLWERWSLLCLKRWDPGPTLDGRTVALHGGQRDTTGAAIAADVVLLRRQFYLRQDSAVPSPDWSTIGYVPINFTSPFIDHDFGAPAALLDPTPFFSQRVGFYDEWYRRACHSHDGLTTSIDLADAEAAPWSCSPLLLTFYRQTDCRAPVVLDPGTANTADQEIWWITYRADGSGLDHYSSVYCTIALP